jgi:hypothetical protein
MGWRIYRRFRVIRMTHHRLSDQKVTIEGPVIQIAKQQGSGIGQHVPSAAAPSE